MGSVSNPMDMPMYAYVTRSVKQLIVDALVIACAKIQSKNIGTKELQILQSNIESDVLLSIPFHYEICDLQLQVS